ncbi:MAG: DUF4136 domain-containing protein [Acidobacteriaceae bacterium]
MKTTMKVWMFFTLVLLIAPAMQAQKVNVDWDHNVQNFSAFKTYSWVKPVRTTSNPLMDQRIVTAIEGQLAAKGLQKVDSAADVLVTYHPGVQQERTATAMGMGGWRRSGGMTTVNQNTSKIGTLVVDMSDAKTKQLIWRASASDTLSDKPDKNSQKIEKAVTKMFKKYPPPAK